MSGSRDPPSSSLAQIRRRPPAWRNTRPTAYSASYRRPLPADDLPVLSDDLRSRARVDANGEVSWDVRDAPAVLTALADAGRVSLGLDRRYYDDDGSLLEAPWSTYGGADPVEARDAALRALARADVPCDWALITWRA